MKKTLIGLLIIIAISYICVEKEKSSSSSNEIARTTFSASENGFLKVNKTSLKNQKGEDIQLKGVSSHGIQWDTYKDISKDVLDYLKKEWGINVFRIAMYTEENGYIKNPKEVKERLLKLIDDAIETDIYVIIDWHVLSDKDPNKYIEQSKKFFDEVSKLYKDTPNVIYEICNEPNGNHVTWEDDIKPYAETIIPIIRKNSPKSTIIVGTPNWCGKLKPVLENPLKYENILYAVHFYAGTHGDRLREEMEKALEKEIPIFVSEWGTTDATGNGEIYPEESRKWIDFLNKKNISWVNWSFSSVDSSSSIINNDHWGKNKKAEDLVTNLEMNLTESGRLIKELIEM